jgi:cation-transporting P-type ATPase E
VTTGTGGAALDIDRDGPDGLSGLSDAEVAERMADGRANDVPAAPSRTIGQIIRANLFTYFNALIGSLLVLILLIEPGADALFGVILLANILIGIFQEVRAKRTLDRLAILNSPKARVVRGGVVSEIATNGVVQDDVLELRPGDQVVVDGTVLEHSGLEVDESLLTGEADAVVKTHGDEVLSGSFVAAGSGRYRATKVGADAYAVRLAEEARRFTLTNSELRQGVNWILRLVTVAIVPAAVLLVWSQAATQDDVGFTEAARGAIAGLVAMVPEGLVLLTSVAFAVGVVRLGRRQCLVQELPAVEVLARVSVICLDKTGTITDGTIALESIDVVDGRPDGSPDPVRALAAMIDADANPNATMAAIGHDVEPLSDAERADGWAATGTVAFSSARKWSAATFAGHGTWVIGAPEILLASIDRAGERAAAGPESAGDVAPTTDELPAGMRSLADDIQQHASSGRRVVLLAHADTAPDGETLPPGLRPAAVVVLAEKVRDDAAETLRYFAQQGVEVRVISGDNPVTVGAVARRVGVPGADQPFDARQLPEDDLEQMADILSTRTVFGRVTPQQKRAMVKALQSRGHVVAMTGDGVNDVLALKDADMGIAMGNGSPATRAVAQIVLLDGRFSTMPHVVAEGRRVIANIERVANLFVTKTVYALILAIAIGIVHTPYPFVPRHLSLVSSLAIGIPGFFLALAPARQRARTEFAKRVLRFTIPTGILVAAAVLVAYAIARRSGEGTLEQHRTTAMIALLGSSLVVLGLVIRPVNPLRLVLLGSMTTVAALAFLVGWSKELYELARPPDELLTSAFVIVAVVLVVAEILWRVGVLKLGGRVEVIVDSV